MALMEILISMLSIKCITLVNKNNFVTWVVGLFRMMDFLLRFIIFSWYNWKWFVLLAETLFPSELSSINKAVWTYQISFWWSFQDFTVSFLPFALLPILIAWTYFPLLFLNHEWTTIINIDACQLITVHS